MRGQWACGRRSSGVTHAGPGEVLGDLQQAVQGQEFKLQKEFQRDPAGDSMAMGVRNSVGFRK